MAVEHQEMLWLHSGTRISLVELAQFSGFPATVLRDLVEYGALTPAVPEDEGAFGADCVARLRKASRLHNDLELDTPALALVLSFLETIQRLEAEISSLAARLPRARI